MKISALAVILTAFLAIGASAQLKPVYTETSAKVCKATKESKDGNYVGICPGTGGYKLEFLEGDLRQTLNVIAPSKKKSELNLWSSVSSGFSSIGEKIEWRVKGSTPQSFIVRFNASENPDDSTKITSYLVVVKVAKNRFMHYGYC